ncbi:MAG: hypothetical protein WCL18_05135 [bacterium]
MIDDIIKKQHQETYYIPMLEEEYYDNYCILAQKLRNDGYLVEQ